MSVTAPKTVKARKPHRCYWCGEVIEVGTDYVRWCCFDGGEANSVEVHPECKVAWDKGCLGPDRDYYCECVSFAEHNRGCLCERGNCECGDKHDPNHVRDTGGTRRVGEPD